MLNQNIEHNQRVDSLTAVCCEYSIAILYAFGSRANEAVDFIAGKAEQMGFSSSDLDIGVLPCPGKRLSAREKVELGIRLEDFFYVGRVDLVVLPEAPPFLASMIVQGERLYVRNEDDADEYDLYVLRKAGDLMPFHRQRTGLILGDDE